LPVVPTIGLAGLLVFFLGAAAVGAVVLCMYDVALLYNLAHLPARGPVLAGGLLVGSLAALVRARAGSAPVAPPGPGMQAVTTTLAAFVTVFLAPSLCIRYCGARESALAGAGILFLAALVLPLPLWSAALAAQHTPRWRGLLGLAVAMGSAGILLVCDAAGRLFGGQQVILEQVLLEHAALCFPGAALAVWLTDQAMAKAGAKGPNR
jgi:hypothetical protein